MIRTVLFDFDGTLVDTNDVIRLALNETSLHFAGNPLVQSDYNAILGKPLQEQMAWVGGGEPEEMAAFYRDFYRSRRDALTREFEGVRSMLDALSAMNVAMGIVSSKGTDGIRHGLEKFDLGRYFSVVLSKYDVLRHKPDPEGLHKAMSLLGADPEETLYVGDSRHDLLAARNAGLPFVLVAWSIADFPGLRAMKPDYIIETPGQLIDIIKACG